jgi:hypothetical protein
VGHGVENGVSAQSEHVVVDEEHPGPPGHAGRSQTDVALAVGVDALALLRRAVAGRGPDTRCSQQVAVQQVGSRQAHLGP